MLNTLIYIEQAFRNFKFRCKGYWFKLYLLMHGCKVGKNLKCITIPSLKVLPKKNITIGNNVTIGRNVTLEIKHKAKLNFGDHVLLSDNILLSTSTEISLENWSAIAENVSVRGTFHEMKKDKPYLLQDNVSEPIIIGEDTGIGANSIVLMGSTIPKGVFIGSNSMVLKDNELIPYGIYAGTPLKLIKMRS